jgi:hypothetical protein
VLIDQVTLMEMFAATFSGQAVGSSQKSAENDDHLAQSTLFETPSQELSAKPISLAQMMGDAPSIMQALVCRLQENGDERAASVLTNIGSILEASGGSLANQETRARKLLDYVYPVV